MGGIWPSSIFKRREHLFLMYVYKYKTLLWFGTQFTTDGRTVAIDKSKTIDHSQIGQFIYEVTLIPFWKKKKNTERERKNSVEALIQAFMHAAVSFV